MRCIASSATIAEIPFAQDAIAALAHEFWLSRGKPLGSPECDWFRAEAELRNRIAQNCRVVRRGDNGITRQIRAGGRNFWTVRPLATSLSRAVAL
jgi:Protein of unknown function (DUF2934)